MAGIDVSVIVPCYNTEAYLDEALSSAEQNDRVSIEIIVLNDGSTDGSLDIMRAHATADSRVRVIDKENQGYGATMNRGISEARGTYVAILEPDDWVAPHMYDDLFEYGMGFGPDTIPDIIKSPYMRVVLPETSDQYVCNCSYFKRVDPGFQPFKLQDAPHLIQHHPSIWSAIYRKGFLDEKGIRFKEVPGAGWVDNPFLIETLCQADSIVYKEQPYYHYREDLPGSSSVLKRARLCFDRWHDMADIIERLNITDDEILQAFYIIGFRYIGGSFAEFGDGNPEITTWSTEVFRRMDPARVVRIKNLSGHSKQLFFELSGYEPIRYSNKEYYGELVKEFLYSLRTNGIGFALGRMRLYARQKATERGLLEQKLDIAE
ncbi:MAG: glycosyltransferase [Acidobacteriota bacterium]|nr:glycosyltransferase [Acidobacteriota bacterium]